MPGVPLTLNLPNDGDPGATYLPALKAAIQAIQADLEPKVVPSEINVNQNFDLAGFNLVGVQHIEMEPSPDATGTSGTAIFYAGDWYLATDSGVVRITQGGALSGTGQRGFVGDYGIGGNPAAATFVDSAGSYQFTEDVGIWADLECDDLFLHGTLAKWNISLSNTAPADKTLTLKEGMLPAVGGTRALLTCDDTGNIDSTETNPVNRPFTVNADITLGAGAELNHSTWKRVFAPRVQSDVTALNRTFQKVTGGVLGGAGTAGVPYTYDLDSFEVGDTITSITFAKKGGAATDDLTTIAVKQVDQAGVETDAAPSVTSQNDIGNTWTTTTVNLGSPVTIGDGESVILRITPAQAGISFGNATVSYTHS